MGENTKGETKEEVREEDESEINEEFDWFCEEDDYSGGSLGHEDR